MALHRIIDNGLPPSEHAWADNDQWTVQSSSGRTIKLVNKDGTFTVLHGIGFTFDGTGEPPAGVCFRSSGSPPTVRPFLSGSISCTSHSPNLRAAFGRPRLCRYVARRQ